MNRFFLIILIAVIFCFKISSSYSQFIEGYVVKNEGDTIKGYLLKQTDFKNAQEVKFKADLNNEQATAYTPDDIISYTIGEDFHISYKKLGSEGKSYFLKEAISGKATLYETFPAINEPLFFIKTEDALTLLPRNTYYGLLKIKLKECPKIKYDELKTKNSLTYSKSSLTDFVRRYNKCVDPNYKESFKKKTKRTLTKGFRLGVSSSNHRVFDPYEVKGDYRGGGFSGGFSIGMPLFSTFSIKAETLYSMKQAEGFHKTSYAAAGYYISKFKVTNHFVDIPVLLAYNLPVKRIGLFVNAGPQLSLKINTKSTASYDISNYSGVQPPDKSLFMKGTNQELNGVSVGMAVGVGLTFNPFRANKRIILESRYSLTPLSDSTGHSANLQTIAMFIEFSF